MFGHLWLVLGTILLANADELLIESDDQCGKYYKLDVVESVTVKYKGGLSYRYRCEIGFTVESASDHLICAQPTHIDIDCGTYIQYNENAVSDFSNDGLLTCEMNILGSTYDETCPEYVSRFFITIIKESSYGKSGNYATIRVFVKKQTHVVMIVLLTAATIIFVSAIIVYWFRRRRRRRRQQSQEDQVTNPATAENLLYPSDTYQSGPENQQSSFPTNSIQQTTTLTDNPSIQNPPADHPPSVSEAPCDRIQETPAVVPSAPPEENESVPPTAEPPPSYDSLFGE